MITGAFPKTPTDAKRGEENAKDQSHILKKDIRSSISKLLFKSQKQCGISDSVPVSGREMNFLKAKALKLILRVLKKVYQITIRILKLM